MERVSSLPGRLRANGRRRFLVAAALLPLAACATSPAAAPQGRPLAEPPAAAVSTPVPETAAAEARRGRETAEAAAGWRMLETADGVELAYRVVGSGAPTVVVPAGSIMGGMEPLAARHRVVFYDPRGRGRSTRFGPELPVSLAHDLADLEAVRAALELDRFALLGVSYYGTLVALYAAEHPERVERLVMAGPMALSAATFATGWGEELAAAKAAADGAAEAELAALRDEGLEEADPAAFCRAYARAYAPGLYADPARHDPAAAEETCELPNERPASFGAWAGALFGALGEWDFADRLRGVRAPALVLQGRRDFRTPPAGATEIGATIPDARVLWLDDTGHLPLEERPDVAYPAILEFLAGEWPEAAAAPPSHLGGHRPAEAEPCEQGAGDRRGDPPDAMAADVEDRELADPPRALDLAPLDRLGTGERGQRQGHDRGHRRRPGGRRPLADGVGG